MKLDKGTETLPQIQDCSCKLHEVIHGQKWRQTYSALRCTEHYPKFPKISPIIPQYYKHKFYSCQIIWMMQIILHSTYVFVWKDTQYKFIFVEATGILVNWQNGLTLEASRLF